jgi:hypothetical protein
MNNRKWVESTILGIIVLNILVLAFVFLIPRVQFMADHWGWKAEALMESSGVRDTPNQYSKTYRMVNQVKKVLLETSIILMPPDNWEFGSSRSVIIQRLYPNKVYFSGDKEFSFQIKNIDIEKPVYGVAFPNDGADLCFEKEIKNLGETGFVICKWKYSG